MYSCNEILKFYRHIICHPYLDDDTLTILTPQGWSSINNTAGKDDIVIDILFDRRLLKKHVTGT
ncbi:hypothetical protein F5B21DRAFT_522702 [Xylaria acuta]|nr:hypothetical protein F5B21DRAFT_522702 [Xylaria acuta]